MSLFEDIFVISSRPRDQKFERVSRIYSVHSQQCAMDLELDIATDIYPVDEGEKLKLVLASTIARDGSPDDFVYDPHIAQNRTLADDYDYVMSGKVYKILAEGDKMAVFASFGGLLLKLSGNPKHMAKIDPDMRLYLLTKKVL
eukprot:ANDGO_05091.mRNA.1 DNA-directed RNA polymerases I